MRVLIGLLKACHIGRARYLAKNESVKYVDRLGDSIFNTGTDKERTNVLSVALKASN